ncbi:hypothetical protein GLOTRDRAFT_129350 [Gloeophyllum trabeum ATCC 11539]|uniref:F-box domain-containing protein n=1 Tax=Gloeophyllum trabeum (strain ATCC 11539 / FP-39264 / Madison 617) TaxID=670483 RepID=S7Q6K5_GLOTA|nr:uncharacterized protein GLOTRDRAFT_129350 [Gloeophyllum trabeum ATCC 11539]EPQ55053.1 hypothetical protein GLOTRDRAFT_129350 [Gloeophyllum trabeum ATCC 11539]
MTNHSPAPQRWKDHEFFVHVPHDVWLEVMEYLRPSRDQSIPESKYDLENLSLTCRYFCAISRPLLFEDVRFTGTTGQDDDAKDHAGWFSEVKKNRMNSLASLVRKYRLCHWSTISNDTFVLLFGDKHFRAIAQLPNLWSLSLDKCNLQFSNRFGMFLHEQMKTGIGLRNLRHLHFSRTTLDAHIFVSLQELPALESLAFDQCSFKRDSPQVHFSLNQKIGLRHFQMIFGEPSGPWYGWNASFMSEIATFACQRSLRVFKTDVIHLSSALFNSNCELAIEDLAAVIGSADDLPIFSQFLDRTPSICSLSFYVMLDSDGDTVLRLKDGALPSLQTLRCLPEHIFSRPVRRYWTVPEYPARYTIRDTRSVRNLEAIASSIEELGIDSQLYGNRFLPAFPSLKSLIVLPGSSPVGTFLY